jgi:hypothetical protein
MGNLRVPGNNRDAISHKLRAAGRASIEQFFPIRSLLAGAAEGDVAVAGIQKVRMDSGHSLGLNSLGRPQGSNNRPLCG